MDTDKKYTSFETILDTMGYLAYTNVGTSMMPLLRQGRDVMEIRKKGDERCKKSYLSYSHISYFGVRGKEKGL